MLNDLLSNFSPQTREIIARMLLAFLALLLTYLLRRVLTGLIIRPFRRRAERGNSRLAQGLITVLDQPTQLLVLAFGLYLAATILEIDRVANPFIDSILRTLVIIAIFIIIYGFVDVLSFSSSRLKDMTGLYLEDRLMPFIRVILKLVVIVVGLTVVLQEWGYEVSTLVAGLGLGSLAISLAAKDTIENLFGFAAVVTDRPFVVGDHVQVLDVEGTVENVGWRSTVLRTEAQSRVTIPNNRLIAAVVVNYSRMNKRYFDIVLKVPINTPPDLLQALMTGLQKAITDHPKADAQNTTVHMIAFADGNITVQAEGFLQLPRVSEFEREKAAIYVRVLALLQQLGITAA
jgi:MscS family membrane protein